MTGRILHVESSFARKASRRGGTGMEEAIAAAEKRVARLTAKAMGEIDACIATALAAAGRLAAGDAAALADLRGAADTMVGLSGLFGLDGLAKAAASLCMLIDWVGAAIDAKAVRVHLEAIQLFRQADAAMLAISTGPVLEGLARVTAHLGVPPPSAAPADPEEALAE